MRAYEPTGCIRWTPASARFVYEGETQYLRVFIDRLRRKIEDDPAHPRIIVTEPGVGYRLLPSATG